MFSAIFDFLFSAYGLTLYVGIFIGWAVAALLSCAD